MSLDIIKNEVCNFYKVTPMELRSLSRDKRIVRARHIYFYLATTMTDNKTSKIALSIYRQWSTCKHAVDTIDFQRKIEKELDAEIKKIENIIENLGGEKIIFYRTADVQKMYGGTPKKMIERAKELGLNLTNERNRGYRFSELQLKKMFPNIKFIEKSTVETIYITRETEIIHSKLNFM